jgi:hypothetical protein
MCGVRAGESLPGSLRRCQNPSESVTSRPVLHNLPLRDRRRLVVSKIHLVFETIGSVEDCLGQSASFGIARQTARCSGENSNSVSFGEANYRRFHRNLKVVRSSVFISLWSLHNGHLGVHLSLEALILFFNGRKRWAARHSIEVCRPAVKSCKR